MNEITIKLTALELDIAHWAVGGMEDPGEDSEYPEQAAPRIADNVLVFPLHPTRAHAVHDFLYRIEEQFLDVVESFEKGAKQAAGSIAKKVRAAAAAAPTPGPVAEKHACFQKMGKSRRTRRTCRNPGKHHLGGHWWCDLHKDVGETLAALLNGSLQTRIDARLKR